MEQEKTDADRLGLRSIPEQIGRYRLIGLLGAGGFGEVYEAEDTQLKRVVALKVTRGCDQEHLARLLTEARAAACLSHPGIAAVYEVSDSEPFFIASEFVEGEALSQRFSRGPLEIHESIELAWHLADALAEAHRHGIVHCDLKPANIVVTRRGTPKVLDFGLARSCPDRETPARDPAEPEYRPQGTVGYMAPELLRGESPDVRTDLFALGVILYEGLAGVRPFIDANRSDEIRKTLKKRPTPLTLERADIPPELGRIVQRALEKDRGARYQTAEEMRADLARLREAFTHWRNSPPVRTAPRAEPLPRSRDLTPLGLSLVGAGLLAFLLPVPISTWMRHLVGLVAVVSGVACIAFARSRRSGQDGGRGVPLEGLAFRGLLPFQEADRDRFYGRDTETERLLAMVSHADFRFGVIFGESGCGKTSLLRAGFIPRARDEGFLAIYCRSQADPITAIVEACSRQTAVQPQSGESLPTYLNRIAGEFQSPVLLVLDQFEETLVASSDPGKRSSLASFVGSCYRDASSQVRVLASIRSDFLYLIESEFSDQLPDPLLTSRLFQLKPFTTNKAATVLDRSAAYAGLPFEPGFSACVAADLAVADRIAPAELQIVGEQLQRHGIYDTRSYGNRGGKVGLVNAYLEEVMEAAPDRKAAQLVLRTLISEEGCRVGLTREEIARRTQRATPVVERVLALFVGSHVVREIQEETPWKYELMHDYLIAKASQLTGKVVDATHRANYLFRQYLSQSEVDPRTTLPLSRLWFIRSYSDLKRGEAEQRLLRRSMVRGIAKAAVIGLCVMTATLALAAYFSVHEEWESKRLFDGHTAAVREAVFSPDGKQLVTAGEDGRVIVWDFEQRRRVGEIAGHKKWVSCVGFSPDGRLLVTGGDDGTFVWDAASHALVRDLGLTGAARLAFSPDQKHLAVSCSSPEAWDGTTVLEVGSWKRVSRFGGGAPWPVLMFIPRSKSLLSIGGIYDYMSGQLLALDRDQGGMTEEVSGTGGIRIGVGSLGRVVFYTDRGKRIKESQAHSDHGRAAAISPDGRWAASGAEDIVLWDLSTLTAVSRFEHPAAVWDLAFSPDGKYLVSTHGDGSVLLWDYRERKRIASLNEHSDPVRTVRFSPNGRVVASGGDDRNVILWDSESGRKLHVEMSDSRVHTVRFSSDGQWLGYAGQSSQVSLLKLATPDVKAKYRARGIPVYAMDFSPDNSKVVWSHGMRKLPDLRFIASINDEMDPYGLACSPDSRLVAACDPLGHVTVTRMDDPRKFQRVKTPANKYVALAYSPDGKYFVTGEDGGAIRLWQPDPLIEKGLIGKHAARVKCVDFSPDGKQVVSASDDRTIALWDVKRKKLLTQIDVQSAPVLSVAFSPEGRRIVAGGHDRSVRLYTRHHTVWGYLID